MPSFNKVFLMGYLTSDPVLRSSTAGTTLCTSRIAVNRRFRAADGSTREDTLFIDLIAYARLADTLHTHMRKGSPLFVEGRLEQTSWLNRQNEKITSMRVVVESIRFIGPNDRVVNPAEPQVAATVAPLPPLPRTPPPGPSFPPGGPSSAPARLEPLRSMPPVETRDSPAAIAEEMAHEPPSVMADRIAHEEIAAETHADDDIPF